MQGARQSLSVERKHSSGTFLLRTADVLIVSRRLENGGMAGDRSVER